MAPDPLTSRARPLPKYVCPLRLDTQQPRSLRSTTPQPLLAVTRRYSPTAVAPPLALLSLAATSTDKPSRTRRRRLCGRGARHRNRLRRAASRCAHGTRRDRLRRAARGCAHGTRRYCLRRAARRRTRCTCRDRRRRAGGGCRRVADRRARSSRGARRDHFGGRPHRRGAWRRLGSRPHGGGRGAHGRRAHRVGRGSLRSRSRRSLDHGARRRRHFARRRARRCRRASGYAGHSRDVFTAVVCTARRRGRPCCRAAGRPACRARARGATEVVRVVDVVVVGRCPRPLLHRGATRRTRAARRPCAARRLSG